MRPVAENCSVRNLPKRDELLFLRCGGGPINVRPERVVMHGNREQRAGLVNRTRGSRTHGGRSTHQTVFAQPKLSMIGLVFRTRVCRSEPAEQLTSAKYCRRILAVSVLPAPDSPEITTDCDGKVKGRGSLACRVASRVQRRHSSPSSRHAPSPSPLRSAPPLRRLRPQPRAQTALRADCPARTLPRASRQL
eukprot:scaffold209784_cov31-Tisochrysis_lutea.AAC.1